MTNEKTAPMTIRCPIDVGTRKGVRREIWTKTYDAPLKRHCAEEMNPLMFLHEYDCAFGAGRKRIDFTLDDYANGVATYRPVRFTKSSWEYRNLPNFGLEIEREQKGETE